MTDQKKHLSYTFYRISIALAVFLAFFFQTFLLVDGTNIFMAHFTAWKATEVSLPITIGGYAAIVTTFLIGSWLIHHKGRGMMLALIVISGLATIMLAFCENSYPLYFIAIIITNITLGALLVLMTSIITNWFSSTRGRMLGFVTIGAPFSTAVCVPVIQRLLMAGVAFQSIFLVFGLVIIVFGVISFLLVPYRPEDVGYHADNGEHAAVQTDTGATRVDPCQAGSLQGSMADYAGLRPDDAGQQLRDAPAVPPLPGCWRFSRHRAEPHDHLRHCGHSPELFLGLAG